MSSIDVLNEVEIKRTARVVQIEGMFDLQAEKISRFSLSAQMPLDDNWQIGLITGPSGSGKSSLAKKLWPDSIISAHDWPENKSVIDGFPGSVGIKEIVAAMSSVGFSSPPAWLRPYHCLSNGEQFRVNLARALVANNGLVVFDEFTSLVDRTVAQIGSAAVSKAIRRNKARFVAVTCHYDVEEWLQPDWVYDCGSRTFTRRLLRQRPNISINVKKVGRGTWQLFRRHHYLSETLSVGSSCYLGTVEGEPAAFTAVVSFPHAQRPGWREHRTVCLPDFQGVGIGNAMSEFIASLYVCTGKPYRSVTSHPAMIAHRHKSPLWKTTREPGLIGNVQSKKSTMRSFGKHLGATRDKFNESASVMRLSASFEYVGKGNFEQARGFGII